MIMWPCLFQHIVICCNGIDTKTEYCISNNEEIKQCVLNEIKCSSNRHESQYPWFTIKYTREPNSEQNKNISSHSQDSNCEDKVPELTLIFHGRLSDLDRYGKLRVELDVYKMFDNLLSVHIISCKIYHIGIKSIIEHNKGNSLMRYN